MCLSVCLYVSMSLSPPTSLPLSLLLCLSVYLSVFLSPVPACLSPFLTISPSPPDPLPRSLSLPPPPPLSLSLTQTQAHVYTQLGAFKRHLTAYHSPVSPSHTKPTLMEQPGSRITDRPQPTGNQRSGRGRRHCGRRLGGHLCSCHRWTVRPPRRPATAEDWGPGSSGWLRYRGRERRDRTCFQTSLFPILVKKFTVLRH